MKKGYLSDYFSGVAVKLLSAVEADPLRSNQHEFGTNQEMRRFLREARQAFSATYIFLSAEQESITATGIVTLYNSRENKPARSPEWRIYYDTNSITQLMREGDMLFVAKKADDHLLFIIAPLQSEMQHQLLWLFGFDSQPGLQFSAREFAPDTGGELDFASRLILDEIGIEYEDPNANDIDEIIRKFGTTLPTTAEFSKLARDTLRDVDPLAAPDVALTAWLDHEEAMFRRLERKIVQSRIETGFILDGAVDVDGFLKFSLSVQNRRKSRMGYAFEHHLAALFDCHGIRYAHPGRTERGNRPDFLFPGQQAYADLLFPSGSLTMLAAKSVCKERWRQILPEADRITAKHLVTIEPGISVAQTNQMQEHSIQLIVPEALHDSYHKEQRAWLWPVSEFIKLVNMRQNR
jgi:hypothetical protein